jgi:hypothetical protein
MRTGTFLLNRGAAALTLAMSTLVGPQVLAAEYWLKAAPTAVPMPDPNAGPDVPVWGYVACTPDFAVCETPTNPITVPGPPLVVPAGENTLIVHLLNSLPAIGATPTPTSLVINGLMKSMAPVWDDGSSGPRFANPAAPTAAELAKRVRSFDAEAAPNGGIQTYTWGPTPGNLTAPEVKPGTYLYQSGTQPQVQVQMGLYGALTKNAADATASTPAAAYAGVVYDNQATLIFSEIDPALHVAVASGSYGTEPTSTFNYQPKYFLINGKAYTFGAPVITPAGNPGQTLLRLLNAGLVTHVPMLQGNYWEVVGEDGKPYPFRLPQYTAMLSAAKTIDVRLTAEVGTAYPIIDRRLNLSNNGMSGGGMLAFIGWGPLASGPGVGGNPDGSNRLPVANPDPYDAVKGVALNIPAPGVLANDIDADAALGQTVKAVAASGVTGAGGMYVLNANGSFSYTPPSAAFTGQDTFNYSATDGQALSAAPAAVTITVAEPTAPALAPLDAFNRADSTNLGGSWSQAASSGSLANIQISANQALAAATDLGGQAIWNAPPFGARQYAAFSANALDKSALILKATGGTTTSPDTYIRVRYEAGRGIVVSTMMSGATAALFVRQAVLPGDPSGLLSAAVDERGVVTVFQGASYKGGVQLPDVPAWKGGGRIGIQLQTQGAMIDNFSGGSLP